MGQRTVAHHADGRESDAVLLATYTVGFLSLIAAAAVVALVSCGRPGTVGRFVQRVAPPKFQKTLRRPVHV